LLFVLDAGFDDGENACFVFDHIVEGAEPTLLNIDGCAGAADGGWIGLPLSCGTLDELELGFLGGLATSFFDANGFKLLHDHPSARASGIAPRAIAMASDNETTRFTVRLLRKETIGRT
jgi:hypothetical protein